MVRRKVAPPPDPRFPAVGDTVFWQDRPVTVMEVRIGPDTPLQGLSGEALAATRPVIEDNAILRVRGANISARCDKWIRFKEVRGWL